MPDTYLDSSIVGFNHQDGLDLKVDTYQRLAPLLNMQDDPAVGPEIANNLSYLQQGPSDIPSVPKIDLGQALISKDPTIKLYAQQMLDRKSDQTAQFKYGLGRTIESPYDDYAKKFIGKDFGYSALRDNEDFYYRNQYMQDGWFTRNIVKNPAKFVARVIPQAAMKLLQGIGYVGSMVGSVGSDNYWADVADNGFSHWFENLEQQYKDRVIPVYKQAGFDDKGFFSKLMDWSFWNDSVADGVAFMASAAIPGMGFAKLGRLGALAGEINAFGKAFSATSKLGKLASGIGMGSWAQLSSWTFNTAMEASMEGAGVFKDLKKKMEDKRAQGDPEYINMTDEQIRERAGNHAANTVAGNFAVLALSNAWENTLFFKPFKNVEGRAALQLGEDFMASSRSLKNLDKLNPLASALSRTSFYGKQMAAGFVAEGLWEENAQLAIQRMNEDDAGGRHGFGGFWSQLQKQTLDAFSGKDKEASESIGLGALIGMGAGPIFSKVANERRNILENTRRAITGVNAARQNLFDVNDIYQRKDDNSIEYDENNRPKIDNAKLAAKQKVYESEYGKLALSNEDDYFQSEPVRFETRRALANYVRSLNNVGITDIAGRLSQVNPENAALFGMNPSDIKKQSGEFASLASDFEDASKEVDDIQPANRPIGMTEKEFADGTEQRKAMVYTFKTDSAILEKFSSDAKSQLLSSLNQFRNLQNTSLSQYPVDQLNTLIQQQKSNQQVMNSPEYKNFSDIEKQYHVDRNEELEDQITQYKTTNELALKDSHTTPNGFYTATITAPDGKVRNAPFDKRSGQLSKDIANYGNQIAKNNHFDDMLSDRVDGFDNFLKLSNDATSQAINAAIAQTVAQQPSNKFREQKQGDFLKVTQLVAKMVFGKDQQYSPEELQLQSNYAKLIEEILPQYENAIENQRIKNLNSRLDTLRKQQAALANLISTRTEPPVTNSNQELERQRQEELRPLLAEKARLETEIKNLQQGEEPTPQPPVTSEEKKDVIQQTLEIVDKHVEPEREALAKEMGIEEKEVTQRVAEKVVERIKNNDTEPTTRRPRSLLEKIIGSIIDFFRTMAIFGTFWVSIAAADSVSIDNGKVSFDTENFAGVAAYPIPGPILEAGARILPQSKEELALRFLEKIGKYESPDQVVEVKPNLTTSSVIADTLDDGGGVVTPTIEVLATVPDTYNTKDSLISYRSTWNNDDGFWYIAGPNKGERKGANVKTPGVLGVGHFLLDASIYDFNNPYTHPFSQNFLARAKAADDYVPVFTDVNSKRHMVAVRYMRFSELDSDFAANHTDYKIVAPLRQFKLDEIDWRTQGSVTGFKSNIHQIKTKKGETTNLIFKDRKGYSRFSGGSVVFIFENKGNRIIIDFAGSIDMIQKESERILKDFNLKANEVTIGYHDVGSFSAKPKSKGGTLETRQYEGYNPSGVTGAALLIPTPEPMEKSAAAMSILGLLSIVRRRRDESPSAEDLTSKVNDINKKINDINKRYDDKVQQPAQSILEEKKLELEILKEELQLEQNGKRADQKRITDAINKLANDINIVEEKLDDSREKLFLLGEEIDLIDQEIKGGSFRGIYGALQELKQERDWLANHIGETKDLLTRVKGLLKALMRVARQLFPTFDFKYLNKIFTDEVYGKNNRLNYESDVVAAYDEIKTQVDKRTNLQNLINELTKLQEDLATKFTNDKKEIDLILSSVNQSFRDQYLDLTKQEVKKPSAEKAAITNNLTADKGVFPASINSGGNGFGPEDGFDGNTYQRPLHTKFFTSTFPDYRGKKIKDLPKDVQDYFDFTEFLTNPENSDNIKKKLGNANVQALVVTRNNVEQLGLGEALVDRAPYFANKEAAITHIELVPVIEEGGYFYYTDKDLNKLGRIDEKKTSPEMVRTVLRLPRYTAEEQQQYSQKYSIEDMEQAVKVGIDWRQQLLDQTQKEAVVTYDFAISRGIANKQEIDGGGLAQNPVAKTILPDNKINGQSVRVFSKPDYIINGENVTLPVGRPFIQTTVVVNGDAIHEQLHAANNKILTPEQITTVNRVLVELLRDHNQKVSSIIANSKTISDSLKARVKDVGLANLDDAEKQAIYLQVTKGQPSLYNGNYTNWLSSIVYFNKLEKDENGKYKTPGKNQMYMDGYMLILGDSGNAIDMTNPDDVSSTEVQDFLASQYHNIKYFPDKTRSDREYLEYYLDGDKLQSRSWKTYAHYLLSEKLPDGGVRTSIPVTTAIKTREQHDLEKGSDPYYTYLSRGLVVQTDAIPVIKKKEVVQKGTNKPVDRAIATVASFLSGLKNKQGLDNIAGGREFIKNIMKLDPDKATLMEINKGADAWIATIPKNAFAAKTATGNPAADLLAKKKAGLATKEVTTTNTTETPNMSAVDILNRKKNKQTAPAKEKTLYDNINESTPGGFENIDIVREIENRRKEELASIRFEEDPFTENNWMSVGKPGKTGPTQEVVIKKVNDKYNAELAALGPKPTASKPASTNLAADILAKKQGKIPDQDVPDYNNDNDEPSLPADGLFRIAQGGVFQTEENLDGVISEMGRMVPQFPIRRLRSTIKVTDGIEAWGQFRNNMIFLHEMGEKGTGYHEVFEAVVNKLLSDAEWNAIYKEFTGRKGYFTDRETGQRLPYSQASTHQAKEEMAEEFRAFKLDGVLPSQKNTRTYFQIIWDFIKSFFTNLNTLDNIFAKIDKGNFAQTTVRDTNRFTSNYRLFLPNLKAQVKRDIMDGMSSFMFQSIFMSPESLTQLDEIALTDEQIYEPIKLKFQETITGLNSLIADEKTKSPRNQKLIQDYSNSVSYIQYTLDNWKETVGAHKEELKPFRIRFEQGEINRKESEDDNRNRNDYLNDEFKTSGKNSASKSVRFLFGTLLQMRFATKDGNGQVRMVNGRQTGVTTIFRNSVAMASVVDYDAQMLQALEQFTGMSDFTQIEDKLRDMSGITEIENMKNPDAQAKLIAGLPREKAVWTSLYMRVFGSNKEISEEARLNLKAKFQNYVSKHAPEPYVFIYGGGNSTIISSTKRTFFETITKKIESSIITQSNLLFHRVKKGGITRYEPIKGFKTEVSYDNFNNTQLEKFIEYLGLSDIINTEFILALPPNERKQLKSKLLAIRNGLTKVSTTTLNLRGLNIFGYTKSLIEFLDEKKNVANKETQFFNIENEPQQRHITPSFISRIIGDINNLSRNDLIIKYPQIDSYFAEDSILMEKLYNEDGSRKEFQLSLGYVEGIKDIDENEGSKSSRLEFWDRYWLQFNATLAGLYYSLPADSETEWAFNMGEFVSFSENMLDERGDDIINKIFIPKLRSELNTIINSSDKLQQFNGEHKSTGYTVGKSLRFFKDILANDKDLVNDIHKEINQRGSTAEKILTSKKYLARIQDAIRTYLEEETYQARKTLIENRLVNKSGDNYIVTALDNSFIERYRGFGNDAGFTTMNEAQFTGLVEYQKINSIIGLMEQFKIFYGDPAQYKDWEKRAKSLFGPIEQTFYDTTGELNQWLTNNKNFAELEGEKVALPQNDWFRKTFTNTLKARTVNDLNVVNVETANALHAMNSAFSQQYVGDYENTVETDGQSGGTLAFGRELMIKSGWRWTKEHENYFQYDNALMRQELSQLNVNDDHYYDYQGNNALKELDKKIVDKYRDNPPTYPLSPVKTLMPSVDENGNQSLLKHSVYFMSYQVAREFELLDTYIDMMKRGDDLLNFKSAQKVGVQLDNNKEVTPYYETPFQKNDLVAAGNPQFEIDYRTIGIQVETQSTGKGQRLGSQLSKDINLNLFEDGIPVDFTGEKEEWDNLNEEERLYESEYYNLVKGPNGTIKSLEALKIKNTLDTFSKLGVSWDFSPVNGLTYNVNDLTKVMEYIHNELQRLQIDANSLENIQLTEDLQAFLNPAETLPSYTTISNLLWSMADKATTSMSVNGKPYIQVASTFFNKKSRKAAYFDKERNQWITVNNPQEYEELEKKGVKLVLTSSELQFYRTGPDGKTLGMEIYLPHIYKQKVNKKRAQKGLSSLSDQELMDHLNQNPELLEGVGFRIPTQATSSLEFFTIKGFLPEAFGSSVVVPSGITTKAGSDFDVDKLNTYLNNWKLDTRGLPYYEKFLDDTNSSPEERYTSFVRAQYRDFATVRDEMRTSAEYADVVEQIEQNSKPLQGQRDVIDDLKGEMKATFTEGYSIFSSLPTAIKQQYYDRERDMNLQDIEGVDKIMEYIGFANGWIQAFQGSQALQLPLKVTNKRTGTVTTEEATVYSDDALPIFEELRRNYSETLKQMGITQQMIDKYLEMKQEVRGENSAAMRDFNFELAKVIAEFSQIQSFDKFSGLPITMQNTKGALENRYFKSLRNVLELPEMFEYLLSPNSISHIRNNRDIIYEARDIVPEDKRELDYTRFLSTEYIAEKRNNFVKGKYDIGIFAVAMTNFANSQISGIGITELGDIKPLDTLVFDTLNDSRIDLPFKDIPYSYKNGKLFIPLSVLKDREGKLTMDKISSYINGAVDVAKEPYIVEMGMHTELAGVYTMMERMGLTGKTTALFLYQPVIREYLKEVLFTRSYFGSFNMGPSTGYIIKAMVELYGGEEPVYDAGYQFTNEQLAAMIRKGEQMKKDPSIQWTKSEKQAQYLAFVNYLKMKMFSNHLLENIQASNHDTSSIRNPWILAKKDLQLDRSKKANMIAKFDGGNMINGAEALRQDTFVKTDISLLKNFNSLFSRMQLFALQRANPQSALMAVAARIYNDNPFITNDDFVSAMREYESSLIDGLVNKVMIEGVQDNSVVYNELYKYAGQFFKTDSPQSLKKRFDMLQTMKDRDGNFIYRDYIRNNYFLQNLDIFTDKTAGVDLMELKKKPSNDDVLTKEKITEAMRDMSQLNEEEFPDIVQFFKALVFGSYIQFGIKYSRKSFVDLIPSEALTTLTKNGLSNIDGEDFRTLDELVQRAKWYKKGIVPEQMQRSMHFISPNPTNPYEMVLEPKVRSKTGSWKIRPTKLSQVFFATDEGGEVVPHIQPAFIWGGYAENPRRWEDMPNIIKIPGVKPEYMVRKEAVVEMEDGNGNVVQRTIVATFPDKGEIDKMKKRGDYSYIFYQEYKKVGIENPALARQMVSGKANKKSVNYLYKPINKFGSRDFNEVKPLMITPENTVLGEKSIIINPVFKEWEDNELITAINNINNKIVPVTRPVTENVTRSLGVKSSKDVTIKKTITMTPDNINKIQAGKKNTTVRTVTEGSKIGIKVGKTENRFIGEKEYAITNRGFLTIDEAGGQAAILESEGLTDPKQFKFKHALDWYEGKGKLYVYDIKPIQTGGGSVGDHIQRLPRCSG